jgi:hypothetical protein
MFTRIRLAVSKKPARDDLSVTIIRLFTWSLFRTFDDVVEPYRAIVDTGSPTSLIPYKIWHRCPVLTLKETVIQGIVDREECDMSVTEGVIKCALSDRHTTLPEMVIRAHLAPEGADVPLLIGFNAMLERMSLYCAVWDNHAYLELPEA